MLRKKRGSLEWLEFELFQDFSECRHAVFLRQSGITDPISDKGMIQEFLQCRQLMTSNLVHGKRVEEASSLKEIIDCDGLITQKKGLGLLVTHADCQAAVFFDPIQRAIGCIHAGWRGNVQNIYKETVSKMESLYGSKAANILVGVSPSLGPCCGEFINYQKELPDSFLPFQVKPFHFDLWEVARFQLKEAGVLPHHIEMASECTRCNPIDFFSYRRQKEKSRHGTVVFLMEDVNREHPVEEI
jgi:YfiH family protein